MYTALLMHRGFLLLALVLPIALGAFSAAAGWTERDSQIEISTVASVVHQRVMLQDAANGSEATLELVRFSTKSCRIRLIDNPQRLELAETMASGNYVAAVNGGYFDENFAPLGLRIADGKTLSPLLRARLLTGILAASDGSVRIVRPAEFSKSSRPLTALQCGPFLVDRGRPISGLESNRQARRTFAATISGRNEAVLGSCSDVSLSDLAVILSGSPGKLKIQRALNLDGGSSSAFGFKREDGTLFSIPEEKRVRDFLGVAPK